jgi:hypothetical protein
MELSYMMRMLWSGDLVELRGGDDGQGCNTWAVKDEAPSDDDRGDYDVFNQHLGMQ